MVIKDIPLRERKQSKTRLAIHDASMRLLKKKHLAQIKVEEICEEVEISRGTFFSYFPRKIDLLYYTIRLWSIEGGWLLSKTPENERGIAFIEYMFKWCGRSMKENPIIWAEFMALRVFEPRTIHNLNINNVSMVTQTDKLLRFPDKPGIEDIPEGTVVTLFRENLEMAIERKELPGNTDIDTVLISLTSILYGVPTMMSGYTNYEKLLEEYERQLNIFWTGLKTTRMEQTDNAAP
ncbi:MAG: hypothetical protein DSY90_01640 [Deltaproteobacteria bacterium]|nr:MAG: hypothetical protein DSY90_01640 [Deltaproteobacteria bacterium]